MFRESLSFFAKMFWLDTSAKQVTSNESIHKTLFVHIYSQQGLEPMDIAMPLFTRHCVTALSVRLNRKRQGAGRLPATGQAHQWSPGRNLRVFSFTLTPTLPSPARVCAPPL
jgi:hypothetical protein